MDRALRPCLYHREEKHTIVSYNRTRRGYGHYDFTICPLSGRVWFCILLPGRSTSWLEHATTYLGRCNIVPWHLDPQNSFLTTDSSNILVPITSSGTILWYYGVFFLWYRHGLMEVSLGQYMKQVWPEGYDSTMLFFYGTSLSGVMSRNIGLRRKRTSYTPRKKIATQFSHTMRISAARHVLASHTKTTVVITYLPASPSLRHPCLQWNHLF